MATIKYKTPDGYKTIAISGGGGGTPTLLIHTGTISFDIASHPSPGTLENPGVTYEQVKDYVDKGNTIMLQQDNGNICICFRAEYVGKQILLHFKKDFANIKYEILLYVNQSDKITYMVSRVDLSELGGGGGESNMDAYFFKEFDEYFDDVFTN